MQFSKSAFVVRFHLCEDTSVLELHECIILKELQLQHPKQYRPPTSYVIRGICVKFSLNTVFFPHFSEIPKTETNFEERLILKAFLLKFMNAYAPIFYVAFFKGR